MSFTNPIYCVTRHLVGLSCSRFLTLYVSLACGQKQKCYEGHSFHKLRGVAMLGLQQLRLGLYQSNAPVRGLSDHTFETEGRTISNWMPCRSNWGWHPRRTAGLLMVWCNTDSCSEIQVAVITWGCWKATPRMWVIIEIQKRFSCFPKVVQGEVICVSDKKRTAISIPSSLISALWGWQAKRGTNRQTDDTRVSLHV